MNIAKGSLRLRFFRRIGRRVRLALASPVVGWNVANDWVMLRHERGHVAVSEARLGSLLELVAGQALALS
ncbi:MAG: hypothetical protein HGA45_36670, partial [Chloroflexales bacterium]|nr:hypothetical protein [Chloroflexales bacterium]